MASDNINKYRTVIDIEDFIDYLISKKIVDKKTYKYVWSKNSEDRLNYLIDKVNDGQSSEVSEYLRNLYPNIEEVEKDSHRYHEALVRGGFPKLPTNSVKRSSEAETLTNKLKNLKPGEKLVVHGMIGCGKSFLVNQVLSDINIVKNYYDYKIYWVNLGEHHNLDNILGTMWRLYSVVILAVNEPPISHCPDQRETLKQLLKDIFLNFKMRNALLILDDAGNEEVISVFDFGCKTVITTKNKKIVPDEHGIFVEVKAAFSEKESLEMFSCLGDTKEIKDHATDIHMLCKGYPMVIATISSFLKESKEDAGNPKMWKYIKENLEGGWYEFEGNRSLENAIKICVDNLKDDLKPYFYDLSIFQQDVNIIPEVLEILWQKDLIQVRCIMKQLADRSLVVSFYHNDLKSYVYGVHDVFLNYLKKVTNGNRVELHRKLINGYNRVTDNNYLNLPNDNYTLQYIGYHLKESEETDKFKIYFDLQFIEAKIRAAGHADVLRDMYNYEKYINRGNFDDTKLNDYRQFITRFGPDIFYNDKTDIIQYALQEREQSHVYCDALEIAHCNTTTPYFKVKTPRNLKNSTHKFKSTQEITAACYVNFNEILIATSDGNIELYDNERLVYSLNEHKKAVTSLKLNAKKTFLLSVSEDHTVRFWKLKANTRRSWDFSTNNNQADPRDRQRQWKSIYLNEPSVKSKVFQFNSVEEFYITADFCPKFFESRQIAIGTNKGVVAIWDTDNMKQICSTGPRRGYPVLNLLFVEISITKDPCIVFSCDSSIFIWRLSQGNKLEYMLQLHNNDVPNSVFLTHLNDIPEIICVTKRNISVWQFPNSKIYKQVYDMNMNSVCATLTNDSHYLIVSTCENSLYIWDNKHHKNIDVMYYWGLTKSLDTYYDEKSLVHVLLISSDKKTLQQCEINPQEQIKNNTDFPVFSSWWNNKIPLTAVRGKTNKIQIFHDYQMFAETEEIYDSITFTKFCDSNNVIYGLQNGQVRLFQFKNRNDRLLTEIKGPIKNVEVYGGINNKNNILVAVSKGATNNVTILYNRKEISRDFSCPKLFFKRDKLLYVVESNGNISSWDVFEDEVTLCYQYSKTVEVITATVCPNKKHLALTVKEDDNYNLYIFKIHNCIDLIQKIKIDSQPTFSCYSFDGCLLAIGMKSGDIQIWNTLDSYSTTILKLHETPVEYLLFSPGLEPILVSLGDQIAWWNLKKLQRGNATYKRPQLDKSLEERCTMNSLYWCSKVKFKSDQYLIACIKLHEQYAKIVSASPDFTSFLTVDGTGRIYILEVV